MRRLLTLLSVILASTSLPAFGAPADPDLEAVGRIKMEAFSRSKVMDILASLTDRYGPRLTASPEFEEAAHWAESALKQYGVTNVHEEKWGPFGRSWSLQSFSLEMTEPRYSHLVAFPLAWTSATKNAESAKALYAPFHNKNRYDITAAKEAFAQYKKEWAGKLKGRVVLITEISPPEPSAQPLFRRDTPENLADIAKAPEPSVSRNIPVDDVKVPSDPAEARKYLTSLPGPVLDEWFDRFSDFSTERSQFFREQGVAAVITADTRAHNGLLFAEAAGSEKAANPMAAPTFVVTEEQYSRMTRLLEKNTPVSLRFNLQVKASDKDSEAVNIIGEIPGRKKPDEIVMIGAHFDSWHSGTGATDNGAGSAVMMEVMRILKASDLPLDRTVRIGLWSGEEQGLLGSKAYVKQHFGDPKTMQLKPEHAKLDAYLNLDNGSGKIRGVFLQGSDAARPLFESWFRPFADMGVQTLTLKDTGGTDHLSFDAVGLPGFQFIQDPLDYFSVTHHSDMDTYPHAVPEDLMQASAVIATLVYDIANRDAAFPRKPLPVVMPAPKKSTN